MYLPHRPTLKPALRRLWRDGAGLQLGIEPRHALVLSGLDTADVRMLDLLDGSRDRAAVEQAAAAAGVAPARARELLRLLARAGALDEPDDADGPAAAPRLVPDLHALSLLHRRPGGAREALRRRRAATVAVHGAGRVGSTVATLLAAAGVGRLHCLDRGGVRDADLAPAGIPVPAGGTRGEAVAAVIRRTTPACTVDATPGHDVDVAVVAPAAPAAAPESLVDVRRIPHLLAVVRETTALLGPFVVPGQTPCVRCVELGRGDRDPEWPGLAAQLVGTARRVDACDVTLATVLGGLAAAHVLTWLDGGGATRPLSAAGVLELDVGDGRLRRRSVEVHPACGCMPAATPGTMTR